MVVVVVAEVEETVAIASVITSEDEEGCKQVVEGERI